jgi:hypothetical protein
MASKTITMIIIDHNSYYGHLTHATINSTMNEGNDIYDALRSAFSDKISP